MVNRSFQEKASLKAGFFVSMPKYCMALISFKDWRLSFGESSPLTRQRDGWARYGSYPLRADYMSHSTPPPFIVEKLKKALGTPEHPKKKKKDKE